MRLGVIGGTFDPVHNGHLFIAEEARRRYELDKVLIMTSSEPPHKPGAYFSPARDRLAMVRMAVEGNPGFEASSIEVDRGGPSYTVETLRTLIDKHPDAELFFITGTDAIVEISTWREPAQVLALSKFIVAARRGVELSSVTDALPADLFSVAGHDRILLMESPMIDISASEIRERVSQGRAIRYLVPEPVFSYIEDSGLYRKV